MLKHNISGYANAAGPHVFRISTTQSLCSAGEHGTTHYVADAINKHTVVFVYQSSSQWTLEPTYNRLGVSPEPAFLADDHPEEVGIYAWLSKSNKL